MRRILLLIVLVISFKVLTAQVPQGFSYQAIARDASGAVLSKQALLVRITIQTSLTGGVKIWEETHSVATSDFGVMVLIIGTGERTDGSSATFSEIKWGSSTFFLKTEIKYSGPDYLDMGTTQLWSVPYSMLAKDIDGSVDNLSVKGTTDNMEEALFEVKNKTGQTVFAVYNEGVRIYVEDGNTKGAKGGFAIGGFDKSKGVNQNYLTVNKDSVRVFLDTNTGKGAKGGFAIGGFDLSKGTTQDYLTVSRDSIRAYIDTNAGKGAKGGFAIGGFDKTKGVNEEYLRVTRDSTRVYLNDTGAKGAKGGFAIGGFNTNKAATDEFLSVTSDSVKVSKSLLIPRLTTSERDNLPFIPGDALIIFNTSEGCMQIFKNKVWSNIWCFNCAPDFIIQPVDKTICSGENAVFFISATGTSLNYKWQQSTDGGTTWNNITNGGTSPAFSGANGYTLTLSNVPVSYNSFKYRCIVAGSCPPDVTSNAVTLNVGSTPPVISSQPLSQILTPGCTANFSIGSPGFSVSYKWQQSTDGGGTWSNISNGGTSPVFAGATTSDLSLSNVPWSFNNNKYRCVVSNLCGGDATSDAANLTISLSSIITQPGNQQLSTDCSANFNITSGDGYSVSYQWQFSSNGGSSWSNLSEGGTAPYYTGTITNSLFLSNVPIAFNNYKFRCIVSSLCGPNETSLAATLTLSTTPIISVQPSDKVVYEGYNISFNLSTSGNGIQYQWQESDDNGVTWSDIADGGSNPIYSGSHTSVLSLSRVPTAFNNNRYRCSVSHYCRPTEISAAALLSVPAPVTVTDIDGNVYSTVGIGSKLWMAENLKTTRYQNGDIIGTTSPATLNISAESVPKYQWAYDGNESNVATYGRLYTGAAAMNGAMISSSNPSGIQGACPTGWHIPSYAEWQDLFQTIGGVAVAGGKMKETGTMHWTTPNTGATNESDFSALPGGLRTLQGGFSSFGDMCFWWSTTKSTEPPNTWLVPRLDYNQTQAASAAPNIAYGLSVRCVKD